MAAAIAQIHSYKRIYCSTETPNEPYSNNDFRRHSLFLVQKEAHFITNGMNSSEIKHPILQSEQQMICTPR